MQNISVELSKLTQLARYAKRADHENCVLFWLVRKRNSTEYVYYILMEVDHWSMLTVGVRSSYDLDATSKKRRRYREL